MLLSLLFHALLFTLPLTRSSAWQAPLDTPSRRQLLQSVASTAALLGSPKHASSSTTPSTADAKVTDRVYFTVKGLPGYNDEPPRIVIGLFGTAAPRSTSMLRQLFSTGLPAACRPKAERALQKEQLEANKVYAACQEQKDVGVVLRYSQIWRILQNDRIQLGAVTGQFVARAYPEWHEDVDSGFRVDQPGVVSVRKGSDSGFGFAIHTARSASTDDLIVVGRVLEGLPVIDQLNQVPVITTAKLNYKALTGDQSMNAPSRACRYGGPMYCNEYKPLIKLTLSETGVL